MCLFVSKTRNKNRRFVYKRFRMSWGVLYSPYQGTRYQLDEEKKAKGVSKKTKYKRNSGVSAGIHCYSNFLIAKHRRLFGEVIVKCSVNPEDWLADGDAQECIYKKITPIKIVYREK